MLPSTWQIIANLSTTIAAFVAIVTLIYIAKQARATLRIVEQNKKSTRHNLTTQLLLRFNDDNYTKHLARAIRFLRDETISIEEKKKIVGENNRKGIDLNLSIRITLNFFEQIGLWYNREILDKQLVQDYIKTASLSYFEQSKWYIDKVRAKFSSSIYTEWEKMNDELKNELRRANIT